MKVIRLPRGEAAHGAAAAAAAATEPVSLQARAADNLAFIRDAMRNAGAFTALPGWGGVLMGVTALGTVALTRALSLSADGWLLAWLGEAALAAVIAGVATQLKARASGGSLLEGKGRRFLLGLLPALAAGAVLTVVLWRAGLPSVLPGLWLLLYGVAVISGGMHSVHPVPLMGACFVALGIAALLSPASWSDIYLAAGFGGLHVGFGLVVARRHGG